MLGGDALLQGRDEGGSGGWAEGERRAGRVLGVADRDHMIELGHLDAVGDRQAHRQALPAVARHQHDVDLALHTRGGCHGAACLDLLG